MGAKRIWVRDMGEVEWNGRTCPYYARYRGGWGERDPTRDVQLVPPNISRFVGSGS